MSSPPNIGDGEGAIPERVVHAVGQCDALSPTTKYIALAMLAYTGLGNPKARVGQKRVAHVAGVNQGQVSKAVKELVQEGIIEIIRPGAGKRPSVIRFNHWPEDQDTRAAPKPQSKTKTSAEGFDLHAEMDKLAGGSGQPSGNPGQLPEAKALGTGGDKVIDILRAGGLKGANLKSMANHPEMTVGMARELVQHAAGADNPGGFMFKTWSSGWRGGGDEESAAGQDWPPEVKARMAQAAKESESRMQKESCDMYGITPEQLKVLNERASAWMQEHPDATQDEAIARAHEIADEIKREASDG